MNTKSLRAKYNTIQSRIQEIEGREWQVLYDIAAGKPHEDQLDLLAQKMKLQTQRDAIIRQLNRPSIVKTIRKLVRR